LRFFVTVVLVFFLSAPSFAASRIKLRQRISDRIQTNVLGTSIASAPNIQVIRSKDGAEYLINKYRGFHNLSSNSKLHKLKRQLRAIDYSKYMVISVISEPMDNYKLKIKNVEIESDIIVVNASYRHQLKNYRIPPKKSIYYSMAVVKKMHQPVLLEAKQIKVKARAKARTEVTVTGRLMQYTENSYQLIPVRIRRGKKNSYYIESHKNSQLASYLGKVVTLRGSVSHEKNSPYEHDLDVERLVKAYE